MQRTQILLDSELKQALRRFSKSRQTSVSELIRTILRLGLSNMQSEAVGWNGLHNLLKISKKGGPRNLSKTIDETLYQL